jgi:hypothetical protein
MRAANMIGLLAAGRLLLGATAAQANDSPGLWADDHQGLVEHQLVPTSSYQADPNLAAGNLAAPAPAPFVVRHLEESALFSDPFLGPALLPELSAGTLGLGQTPVSGTSSLNYEQRLDVDLYLLQLRMPVLSTIAGQPSPFAGLDADLLLPWKIDRQNRMGVLLGTQVTAPTGGGSVGLNGFRFQGMYGFQLASFDIQGRLGLGQPSLDLADSDPRMHFLYGAQGGYRFADWGRAMVEIEGATAPTAQTLRLAPGLRFFPLRDNAFQAGVAALFTFTGDPNDTFALRDAGALVDLSYHFL